MNRMTSAYAAGLIDGEGCVLIQETRGTYHHLVTVGMTQKARAVLDAMERQYGGATKLARAATSKWDAAYAWTVAGDAATRLLTDVQPFLILKAEQARIALRVAEIRKSLPPRWASSSTGQRLWTDEARQRCSTLKRRMHELNAKGPSEPPTTRPPAGASPIARLVAGVWVTDQADLLSDLGWESFSASWPVSGMTRSGTAYALPTSEPPTDGSGSSLLPTPMTEPNTGNGHARNLGKEVRLLQTPSVADAMGGHLSRGGARSNELLLKGQVKEIASSHPRAPATPTEPDTTATEEWTCERQ